LEKRSTCGEFGCFFRMEDGDVLKEYNLAGEVTRDRFALF